MVSSELLLHFLKRVVILRKILYNICMKSEHRGILMAKAAEKLNITGLAGVAATVSDGSQTVGLAVNRFGRCFKIALDKAANHCAARLSDVGGGAQIR